MSTSPVIINPAGEILADDKYLGTIAKVDTGDGGYVYEATGWDGTKVRRFSPLNTAYALRDAMEATV